MGIGGRHLATVAILALAATVIAIAVAADEALAQLPEISITIPDEQLNRVAHPTDIAYELLTYTGEVALSRPFWPPGASVDVELELEMRSVPTVWEAFFHPDTMNFKANSVQNFTVEVKVPQGLSSGGYYTLVFNATASNLLLYNVRWAVGQVTVAQYYKIGRQFSTEPLRVTQGQEVGFNITLINRGNGDDTFLLEITNEGELLQAGLNPAFKPEVFIKAGKEATADFTLTATSDAIVSEFTLNLTIRSEGSTADPGSETVTNGAEWTVIVEPGLTSTLRSNLKYIVPGVAIPVVVVGLVVWSRRRRAVGDEEEEETARPAKKARSSEGKAGKAKKSSKTGKSGKAGKASEEGPKRIPKRPPEKPPDDTAEDELDE